MKKTLGILIILCLLFAFVTMAVSAKEQSKGNQLYFKGASLEKQGSYIEAGKAYKEAMDWFIKNKEERKADFAHLKIIQMKRIVLEYPFTRQEADKMLKEVFKGFSQEQINEILADVKLDHLVIGGKSYYFHGFLDNIYYRYPELRKYFPENIKKMREFSDMYKSYFLNQLPSVYELQKWNSFVSPLSYLAKFSINIPHKKFPKKGTLKIWVPAPIQTACQQNVKTTAITPQEYLKSAPHTDEDIGIAYFEIPLEELTKDIDIELTYSFDHYEQYFRLDPNNLGLYNSKTQLYGTYTGYTKNICPGQEVKDKALKIVGDEKNPYLRAKKIYDYIIDNVSYSYTPHVYLDQLNISETAFVLKNNFGDCGAQSMYFAALCRSLGIPARATGGMLLTPGKPSTHFWAEFYVPSYGWIPVDTTIVDALLASDSLTPAEKKKAREYYFGGMDPYRMVIQSDVDISLSPLERTTPIFSTTFQTPRAECLEMQEDPNYIILEGFKTEITPLY
ncbi:MAG: transglutaminase-like domain-containing protein [Armatimonadota bacterium]